MDAFLHSARAALSVSAVDFDSLRTALCAATTLDAARDLLAALLDAYSACDGTVYQCAMVCAVGAFLRHALHVSWRLCAEDYILIALFLNELSTVTDAALFTALAAAISQLFAHMAAAKQKEEEEEEEEEEESLKALRGELRTLQGFIANRAVFDRSGAGAAVPLAALECLRAVLAAQLQSRGERTGTHKEEKNKEKNKEEEEERDEAVRHALDGVLAPLAAAVDASSARHLNTNTFSSTAQTIPNGPIASPLLVAVSLRIMEELFTHAQRCAGPGHCAMSHSSCDAVKRAARYGAGRTLSLLQRYLAQQQQQQQQQHHHPNQLSSSVGTGLNGERAFDPLRTLSAQRAIRRALSAVPLCDDAMDAAVAAALNAFGGRLELRTALSSFISLSESTHVWDASHRMRRASRLLPLCATATGFLTNDPLGDTEGNGNGSAEGNGDFGPRAARLPSSVGPVTAHTLAEMVMLSIRRMDIPSAQSIASLHLAGLAAMQNSAAARLRKEEKARQRRVAQEGVDGIACGRLVEHIKDAAQVMARGAQRLDGDMSRAAVMRAAFLALLEANDATRGEAEVRQREAQGLVARAFAQLPHSVVDMAMDAICVRVRRGLSEEKVKEKEKEKDIEKKEKEKEKEKKGSENGSEVPAYALAMQVLFALFTARAPVREQSTAFAFATAQDLMHSHPNYSTMLHNNNHNNNNNSNNSGGGSIGGHGGSAAMVMVSRAQFTIDTDSPVAWLHGDAALESEPHRKRARGADSTFLSATALSRRTENRGRMGTEDYEETLADVDDPSGSLSFYRDDTIGAPCLYSHFLCRLLELFTEAERPALLLDALLNAPCLTRYVWHYLHRRYCLSNEKARVLLGVWLLRGLAERRAVCRRHAVDSLLHIACARAAYPRRLAVAQLGALLAGTSPQNNQNNQNNPRQPCMDAAAEQLLVRFARRQVATIPATTMASLSAAKDEAGPDGALGAMRERLDRQLAPFLMLCARQPRELFPALLDVYAECNARGNKAMAQLLAAHVDIRRMCQRLFRSDALGFMANVMPFLRRHSGDASVIVQRMLWAVSAELRAMAQEGFGGASAEQAVTALLGHARVMYEGSEIQIPVSNATHPSHSSHHHHHHDNNNNNNTNSNNNTNGSGSFVKIRDVRFIAPFLSLSPAEELRHSHLRSFLHFVQHQLQLQQQQQHVQEVQEHGQQQQKLDEDTAMSTADLQLFVRDVVREVLVRSPVRMSDNVARGLSRVDLFVYLHRAAHDTRGAQSDGGVLGSAGDNNNNNNNTTTTTSSTTMAGEALPVSPVTTKEVIRVLLGLTRTFDDTTAELLYGPEEIKSAVRQMMQRGGAPVPSQLMATLILACGMHAQRPHADLVRFVHQTVLLPLAKDAMWEKDVQLWRGVLLFAEMHYVECSTFLVNLPDQVLIHALRDRPQLCEYFKEEHGNNASFGHILGSL